MDGPDIPKNLNTFLEEYLESIGDNSKEIRRDLELIQVLDAKYADLITEIENLKTDLLETAEDRVKKGSIDNVEEILSKDPSFLTFKSKIDQAISISEEKVQLSQRITRLMENSLSRLSSKIDEYGEERKIIESSQAEVLKNIDSKSKKKQKEEPMLVSVESTQSEDQRVYCICRQNIGGDMIGCDNDHCPIKWFHIQCVGLSTIPDGTWYCPDCRKMLEKTV